VKWKLVSGFLLGILLISLFAGSVFAIGDPEGGVSILDTFAFRDVLASGDQLYFVRYCVNFTSVPEERAVDTWQMVLYDYLGALVATRPLNYFGENIISIYLEPDEALPWGYAHQIQVGGMPSVYGNLTEGINQVSYNLSVYDYLEGTYLGDTMLAQATTLESDLGLDLLSTSGRLIAVGSQLFQYAVPKLTYMVPTIFESATEDIDVDYNEEYDTSYGEGLRAHEGASLTGAITSLGNMINVNHDAMAFWLIMIFFLCMGGLIFSSGGNPGWALVVGYACLAGAAYLLGGTIFILATIIPVILAIIFGILFILGKFA
jgi:hypothetical protein